MHVGDLNFGVVLIINASTLESFVYYIIGSQLKNSWAGQRVSKLNLYHTHEKWVPFSSYVSFYLYTIIKIAEALLSGGAHNWTILNCIVFAIKGSCQGFHELIKLYLAKDRVEFEWNVYKNFPYPTNFLHDCTKIQIFV